MSVIAQPTFQDLERIAPQITGGARAPDHADTIPNARTPQAPAARGDSYILNRPYHE